ncbi:MAG TPA: peptidase M1, partial [Bacteroidia bacterium]|nr:peptidase M1 [Bacteroidia bacterium]
MKIDSVKLNSSLLTYTYNDTVIKVNLPASYNTTDTLNLNVFYHGKPQGDPSGWGGFYFSGNYAFNLGVGFGAKPHNYGRVWFPCFDNFVEKSLYDFNIT